MYIFVKYPVPPAKGCIDVQKRYNVGWLQNGSLFETRTLWNVQFLRLKRRPPRAAAELEKAAQVARNVLNGLFAAACCKSIIQYVLYCLLC